MKQWTAQQVAAAAGATVIAEPSADGGPDRATIDSRDAGPGALFVGLPGATHDGGASRPEALQAGAWGVLTTPEHAEHAARVEAAPDTPPARRPVLLARRSPLAALQRLATAWRRELGAQVIGVTGSTGKTSTKDLLRAADSAPPDRRLARQLQHRDRAAAGDPGRPRRDRGAGAGDGDARRRADRRAGRDRRARRGGDRQRRTRPSRAAGHDRGHRRRQGRADRRARRPAAPPSSRPASRCSIPSAARRSHGHLRRRTATSGSRSSTTTAW